MKSRRHVIMFQERFAPKVERGEKPHTIRPRRKRRIRAGDTLDLRAWTGKPYRSKQRKLREVVCLRVVKFRLYISKEHAFIRVGQEWLHKEPADALARRDGFADVIEMVEWFERTHALPFTGQLIEWAV